MPPSLLPNSSTHDLRTRLAEIDDERAALLARLRLLAVERKPVVEALRRVIYPAVADLPVEIIIEIFLRYFTHVRIGAQEPVLGRVKNVPDWVHPCGPLLLASVCRKWRDVALSLKRLWSAFYVPAPPPAMGSVEKLLDCWLPRAGDHLLHVSLFSSQNPVLAYLSPHLHRVGGFYILVDTHNPFPNETLQGKLPHFRTLNLTYRGEGEESPTVPITAFADAPELRAVTLTTFPAQSITLPWTQLLFLEINGVFPHQCLDVLRNTTALETLIVDLADSEFPPPPAALLLPNLHTLRMGNHQHTLYLLGELTLPALKHIQFSLPNLPPLPNLHPAASDNVRASSSALICVPRMEKLLACLRAAGRTLTTVHLEDVAWSGGLLKRFLHALRVEEKLVPNLSTLSFNPYVLAVEVPYKDVAEMISGRRGKLTSFELLVAESHRLGTIRLKVGELDEGLDALYALEAEGVKLNLRTLQKLSGSVDSVVVYPPSPPDDL